MYNIILYNKRLAPHSAGVGEADDRKYFSSRPIMLVVAGVDVTKLRSNNQ
jgi:hypothetical protein